MLSDANTLDAPPGRLAENVMHFARCLRAAGVPVGPSRVVDAVRALEATGLGTREDFYWTLHSTFVSRREQHPVFDQAFHIFWRNPKLLEQAMSLLMPEIAVDGAPKKEASRRLQEAMGSASRESERPAPPEVEFDASMTASAKEVLRKQDFEQMSAAELAAAKAMLARLRLPVEDIATRRTRPNDRGPRVDLRATLKASLRAGGDVIDLKRRAIVTRPPPLVALCDVSGSMSRYSRMFLHFLHAITNDRDRAHVFVFGTRLTNVTRALRHKDVDDSLAEVTKLVEDWSGGTRIGATLEEFNKRWSRRVLGQGAVVLLITDGLDRDGGAGLEREIERLHKSCRRLVWLNPLLRWDGFEPKAKGVRAILPHVDEFRPVHNIESLGALAAALSAPPPRRLSHGRTP